MKTQMGSFQRRSLLIATTLVIAFGATASPARTVMVDEQIRARVASAMTEPTSREVLQLFRSLKARSGFVLNRLKQYPDLVSSYYFFDPRALIFSTQASQQEKMIAQMDFAKDELSNSKLVRLKTLKDDLQKDISDLKERNVELRTQLGDAIPSNELGWGTFILARIPVVNYLGPVIREDVQAEIDRNNEAIGRAEASDQYVVTQLIAALNSYGIKVDEAQVKVLFATVGGDQDLQIISAYDNVRKITMLIQEQLKPGQTTAEIGREYYGMYALMLASLIRIHENQLSQINDVYLAKLSSLITKATETRKQATILLAKSQNSDILKGNIKANTEMIAVAQRYQAYLQARATRIKLAASERRQAYLEVLNTYKTYDVAQSMLELVQSSQANLNALDALSISELPQLVDLGDQNIIDQLSQVTLKIR